MPAAPYYADPVKRALKLAAVGVAIFIQIAFLLIFYNPYPHGDMIDLSYRHEERLAAYYDYLHHPSPVTANRLNAEGKQMHQYERATTLLKLIVLLTVNAFGIYYFLDYGDQKRRGADPAETPAPDREQPPGAPLHPAES